MFWRFGFHNASTIDSLLDKEDVSLEAILDEDDLLQECKAQNPRLVNYFQRVDILQRLLGYVTGQIEGEDKGRFKYPYVATEVLCSEIWTIVETCVYHSEQLLTPFWEIVLDRSPDDMKTEMVMASHFAKINAVFLSKKPEEMLAFIQSQPEVVQRLLRHIETPAFADLLVRIIQLDELPTCSGVLEWLSKENLMSRLIDLLSPAYSPDMHTVVSELIKGIISMAAPSPAAGVSDGLNNVPPSNCFARELAHRDSVTKLVSYILCDFGPVSTPDSTEQPKAEAVTASSSSSRRPDPDCATSSVVQSICIIIELIRQNNSDYFEPYLFHTLRNRLIQVQQHLQMNTDGGREALESAMKDMVNRMGVVHLGPLLEIMCDKLDELQQYLRKPRSLTGHVLTTVGELTPLTFERYRICELYAELLHCSNMSLLNRPREYSHLYDSEGRLQGGLSALEELAQVIAIGSGSERDQDDMDDDESDEVEHTHDFPVTHAQNDSLLDSDEDMSGDDEPGSSDDDAMEEIAMYEEPRSIMNRSSLLTASPRERLSPVMSSTALSSSPNVFSHTVPTSPVLSPSTSGNAAVSQQKQNSWSSSSDSDSLTRPRSSNSRRSLRRTSTMEGMHGGRPVTGERLKQRFLEANVVSTLLDLFFDFPWNNFLHSVVYDLIHQILTGRIDGGFNRELTIALFRDARLMHRIIEGSERNDLESTKPKGLRMGYMGHLTLISEDVIGALEHFPPDLRLLAAQYAPQPEWDEYVTGRYKETKKKDTSLLGGGKPVIAPGMRNGSAQWKVDEADTDGPPPVATTMPPDSNDSHVDQEMKGEFRRTPKMRESSADFGHMDDDDEEFSRAGPPHFAHYLAQEMQSAEHFESADEASDDEEEDGGWLAQSTFELRPPPVSARQYDTGRRPLSSNGFHDSFAPATSSSPTTAPPYEDPFEDDAFGPFSDAAAASGTDPFTFPSSSFTEDASDETSFDTFGDFGDFQSAGSGSVEDDVTTPTTTADSWSFASTSSTGSLDDSGARTSEAPPPGKEQAERTASAPRDN